MKIFHDIATTWSHSQGKTLAEYGVRVEVGEFSYIVLEHPVYEKLLHHINKWDLIKGTRAEFSRREIVKADWLVLKRLKTNGYPQPENDYLNFTYDLSDYCPDCGSGAIQKAPFRITQKQSKNADMFYVNWVFDEIFINIEIYKRIFEPRNISSRPVIIDKLDQESKTIVQLDIPKTLRSWRIDNIHYQVCTTCKRAKYSPEVNDFYPTYDEFPNSSIFKSQEFFGPGKLSYNLVLINKEIGRLLTEKKLVKLPGLTPLK